MKVATIISRLKDREKKRIHSKWFWLDQIADLIPISGIVLLVVKPQLYGLSILLFVAWFFVDKFFSDKISADLHDKK